MSKTSPSPHLFDVNNKADKLDKYKALLLHHLLAKLLYLIQ